MFFSSILGCRSNVFDLFKRMWLFCFFFGNKIFYNAEYSNGITFSYFSSESKFSGVNSRWQNTRALSLSWRFFNTLFRFGPDKGRSLLLLCLQRLLFNTSCQTKISVFLNYLACDFCSIYSVFWVKLNTSDHDSVIFSVVVWLLTKFNESIAWWIELAAKFTRCKIPIIFINVFSTTKILYENSGL